MNLWCLRRWFRFHDPCGVYRVQSVLYRETCVYDEFSTITDWSWNYELSIVARLPDEGVRVPRRNGSDSCDKCTYNIRNACHAPYRMALQGRSNSSRRSATL